MLYRCSDTVISTSGGAISCNLCNCCRLALGKAPEPQMPDVARANGLCQESNKGLATTGLEKKKTEKWKNNAKTKTRKRTQMHIARVMVFCRSDIAPRFRCFGRRGGGHHCGFCSVGFHAGAFVLVLRPLVIALFVGGLFMPPWRHGHLLVTRNVVVSKIVTHNVCVFPYFTG